MPPIYISFMLNCYCSSDPEANLGTLHWNSPAGRETREWLSENGLIDDQNRATARGEAWVRFICETPLPAQAWVRSDEDGVMVTPPHDHSTVKGIVRLNEKVD